METYSFSLKSSWSTLVRTRRSTVLILPLQYGFPGYFLGKGRLSALELFVLTSLDQLLSIMQTVYRTSYPNEEVKCTEPSLSVSLPCFCHFEQNEKIYFNNWIKFFKKTFVFWLNFIILLPSAKCCVMFCTLALKRLRTCHSGTLPGAYAIKLFTDVVYGFS